MRRTIRYLAIVLFLGSMIAAPRTMRYGAGQTAVDRLSAQLKDRDPKVRERAAKLLGEQGDPTGVPALAEAVTDLDEDVRFAAVNSLGEIRSEAAIPALVSGLADPAKRVRERAVDGLVALYVVLPEGGSAFNLVRRVTDFFSNPVEDLAVNPWIQVDERAAQGLKSALTDRERDVRLRAARALGILRAREVAPELGTAMMVGDRRMRAECLRAFAKMRDPANGETIAKLLRDTDDETRAEASRTLGLIGARNLLPELRRMYEDDPGKDVRRAAFEAMSLMPEPGLAGLFESKLAGEDRRLREYAADGLARLPQASSAQLLRTRFSAEKDRRVTLALAFALVARQEMPYLQTLMESLDSPFYRDHGIAYLVELGHDSRLLPGYYPFLRNEKPDIRRYLCLVLERVGNPEAMEQLKPTMSDPVDEVAVAATRAYRALGQVKK